jgi:hypothetical protein
VRSLLNSIARNANQNKKSILINMQRISTDYRIRPALILRPWKSWISWKSAKMLTNPGANPTIVSCNASALIFYNATPSLVRFETKIFFLLCINALAYYNVILVKDWLQCWNRKVLQEIVTYWQALWREATFVSATDTRVGARWFESRQSVMR